MKGKVYPALPIVIGRFSLLQVCDRDTKRWEKSRNPISAGTGNPRCQLAENPLRLLFPVNVLGMVLTKKRDRDCAETSFLFFLSFALFPSFFLFLFIRGLQEHASAPLPSKRPYKRGPRLPIRRNWRSTQWNNAYLPRSQSSVDGLGRVASFQWTRGSVALACGTRRETALSLEKVDYCYKLSTVAVRWCA